MLWLNLREIKRNFYFFYTEWQRIFKENAIFNDSEIHHFQLCFNSIITVWRVCGICTSPCVFMCMHVHGDTPGYQMPSQSLSNLISQTGYLNELGAHCWSKQTRQGFSCLYFRGTGILAAYNHAQLLWALRVLCSKQSMEFAYFSATCFQIC